MRLKHWVEPKHSLKVLKKLFKQIWFFLQVKTFCLMFRLHIDRLAKALIYCINCCKDIVRDHRRYKIVALHLFCQNLRWKLRPIATIGAHLKHHRVTAHWINWVMLIRLRLVDEALPIWKLFFRPRIRLIKCWRSALSLPHWNLAFRVQIEAFVLKTISSATVDNP